VRQRLNLEPYELFMMQFDSRPASEWSTYEQVWMHSCMLKPGFNQFFIVYRYDEDRFFKGSISSVVPIRALDVH